MAVSTEPNNTGLIQVSLEKALLVCLITFIWVQVLVMGKFLPHYSAALLVMCFMLAYSAMSYAAALHHRRKKARNPDPPPVPYFPHVSILIAAHNEETVIRATVENILKLDYERFDLCVLDDRSRDKTADVLRHLAMEHPERFKYVVRAPESTPGKSAVLNDGLKETTGEIIAVFDADAKVRPDFLTKLVPYLLPENIGAVQARKVILNAPTNLLTRCQNHEYMLDAHFQLGRDAIKGAVELRGNGQLVKRKAVEAIGGWNEETITDDLDLSTQLLISGWDIRFTDETFVEEEGIVHFKALLKQRRRWAEGSLKRYLEHTATMMTSPIISRRATFDMVAYFVQFAFPIWVTADITVQLFNLFFGDWPNHLFSSLIVIPLMGLFFASNTFAAVRHYQKTGIFQSLYYALETTVFLVVVWVPVVMWITNKVLFTPSEGPLDWGKTEHLGTQSFVRQSRLAQLRELIKRKTGISA